MAVEARYFLDGRDLSARFADFVPQKMKYVALIAACPSEVRHRIKKSGSGKLHGIRAQARQNAVLSVFCEEGQTPYHDKLSRSK